MKIGFQGVRGAYSEAAIYKYFGEKNITPIGHETFEDVFESLSSHQIDMALLPVENSIVGSVSINIDLLFKHDYFIIGEEYLPVEHCLLGTTNATLEGIEYVYSHPVALDQCRVFLKKHNITPIATYDTAGSAKMIAEKGKLHEASISSSLCTKYYGLKKLAEDIQDTRANFTRFFLFTSKDNVPKNLKMEKTTLAFNTKHHAGALLNCLTRFSSMNINLTKLESRPIPENPFEYTFFVDLIGSIESDNVKICLKKLKDDTQKIKILGSYPMANKEFLK